jgi:hypothetical protein
MEPLAATLPPGVTPPLEPPALAPARAWLEVLDHDGQVRQAWRIENWPLAIGRALDNDVVLADPHVAAHHLRIEARAEGLQLQVGATRNGVAIGARRLAAGGRCTLGATTEFSLGRTRLRLRQAGEVLAPEVPLADIDLHHLRIVPTLVAGALLLGGILFDTWLDTDPDRLARAAGAALLTALTVAAIWCGVWALLSKTFTRQANFGWHLRVFVLAGLALLAMTALPDLLAYTFSWPWVSDYAFVASYLIGAAALYGHMLAVEPSRERVLRVVAASGAAAGIGLTLWLNVQRSGHLGDELYMSHLLPPALRLAPAQPVDRFVAGMAALRPKLERQAQAPETDDAADRGDEDER